MGEGRALVLVMPLPPVVMGSFCIEPKHHSNSRHPPSTLPQRQLSCRGSLGMVTAAEFLVLAVDQNVF